MSETLVKHMITVPKIDAMGCPCSVDEPVYLVADVERVVELVTDLADMDCMNTLSRNNSCNGTGVECLRCRAQRLLGTIEGLP